MIFLFIFFYKSWCICLQIFKISPEGWQFWLRTGVGLIATAFICDFFYYYFYKKVPLFKQEVIVVNDEVSFIKIGTIEEQQMGDIWLSLIMVYLILNVVVNWKVLEISFIFLYFIFRTNSFFKEMFKKFCTNNSIKKFIFWKEKYFNVDCW